MKYDGGCDSCERYFKKSKSNMTCWNFKKSGNLSRNPDRKHSKEKLDKCLFEEKTMGQVKQDVGDDKEEQDKLRLR
jgi:hypothetical protein